MRLWNAIPSYGGGTCSAFAAHGFPEKARRRYLAAACVRRCAQYSVDVPDTPQPVPERISHPLYTVEIVMLAALLFMYLTKNGAADEAAQGGWKSA